MIGIVLLAALLLLTLAIYIAVQSGPASEDPKNDQTEDYAAMIARRYPGSAAFDAAFEKHIAPQTDKYFSTRTKSGDRIHIYLNS